MIGHRTKRIYDGFGGDTDGKSHWDPSSAAPVSDLLLLDHSRGGAEIVSREERVGAV